MKKIIFLLLFFCNSLYSQSSVSTLSKENSLEYLKSHSNELLDEFGNRIFYTTENDSLVFSGQAIDNYFGFSISSAGDVNGDGIDDIIVGAYNYSNGRGRAYIFYGGILMDNVSDVIFTGELPGIYFGFTVSGIGDVNGDGYSDVIVSALYFASCGKTYIYFGGHNMNNIADLTITGLFADYKFGYSASTAGDVNADGFSDIIIGAPSNSNDRGKAYIYYGGTFIDSIPDVYLLGDGTNNFFGNSVSSAGDVNGDGYSDVIVGAPWYNNNDGRSYIFLGGSSMNNEVDLIFFGDGSYSQLGYCVSNAGDVNGDGYSDVISCRRNGSCFVYFGGITMNNVSDVTLNGNGGGRFASIAGDINLDGFSDVIIGNYGSRGSANVYYGGSIMDNSEDITFVGDISGSPYTYGNSVSNSGDFNGDGYPDVLVAAHGYESQRGKVYLYFNLMPKPELICPVKNSINNPVDITFKWKKIKRAVNYNLNVSTDSLFNNIIVNDTLSIDTSIFVYGLLRDIKYYWRVIAKDSFDVFYNSLIFNFTTIPPININMKLLFEGMYSPSFNQMIRKDSVIVYLRQSTPPFIILDSAKTDIDSILSNGLLKYYHSPTGIYYLSVRHFNSLETWSKAGGENIVNDGTIYNYDFTSTISQAYGNNLKLKGSKYCLYSGDVNQDGFITLFDVIPIYNDAINYVTGRYIITDLTGDNIVDLADLTLCYNNSVNFISKITP